MKILSTILITLTLATIAKAGSFALCVMYDPDAPTKGVVVMQPENGRTRIMLAESVKMHKTDEGTIITVSNFTMLAESDKGTQYIKAGTTELRYGVGIDDFILINNYPCSVSRAPDLFPEIPGDKATESLRSNPTPLKWGNMVEDRFITDRQRMRRSRKVEQTPSEVPSKAGP